jgi:hypothetical protein
MKIRTLIFALLFVSITSCAANIKELDPLKTGLSVSDQYLFIGYADSALQSIEELKGLRSKFRSSDYYVSAYRGSTLATRPGGRFGLFYGLPMQPENQNSYVFVMYYSSKFVGVGYNFILDNKGRLLAVYSSMEG